MSAPKPAFGFLSRPAEVLVQARPEDVGLSSERLARVRAVLEADIDAGKMPGGVLAIARRGKLAVLETYGFRDKVGGIAMTADSLFNIASMTKAVTSVAALQLYERGRLLMDDPIAKYLPKFADMKVAKLDETGANIISTEPARRPITIQDLMRHTSGLVYGGRGATAVHKLLPEGSGAAGAKMTPEEFIEKLTSAPLYHQPGAAWDYGFGLDVLGLIIEQIEGKRLGEYFREHIFAPLGMDDTSYLVPKEKGERYAVALPNAGGPFLHDCREPLKFECGGACLASTAPDYLRFALALLNRGKFNDERILSRKTVEYMTSDHLDDDIDNRIANADPTRAGYRFGLGVAVRSYKSVTPMLGSIGEFNWPGAGGTNWWADPREDLAVVYMAVTPGPVRWHYRQLINALVYQALD
jgi:CubicO group peptidase (beta-lactamase class C family)